MRPATQLDIDVKDHRPACKIARWPSKDGLNLVLSHPLHDPVAVCRVDELAPGKALASQAKLVPAQLHGLDNEPQDQGASGQDEQPFAHGDPREAR
jgi:hypothetical protein